MPNEAAPAAGTPAPLTVNFPAENFGTPAQQALAQANDLIVDSQYMYEHADGMQRQLKKEYDELEAARVAGKAPILAAGRNWDALFARGLDPRKTAIGIIRNKMIAFAQEQERKREEERRAEELRQRQEQERIEREAREQQERAAAEAAALNQQAEAAAASGDEQKAAELATQAAVVEETGHATAEVMRETAQVLPVAAPTTQLASAAGTHIQKPWVAEVTDKAAALNAWGVPAQYHGLLDFSTSALNQYAKATKGAVQIPGIRFFQQARLNSR